jgi:CubicO group peptidase (beta-lactamase class C family)
LLLLLEMNMAVKSVLVCRLSIALLALAAPACLGASNNPSIDRVFAAWDKPDSPGCALAVMRAGAMTYVRGYGSANLELAAPITPDTVFDIGSVSKQFTAMSIVLLAEDGKLSLDDDIHKFVPELPSYGPTLSLRTLLHHLSGLPSYTDLFDLAGVPEIDQTTDADALALIARQKTLNFPPGRQYLYSDTNYFLLALVVRRVSGATLRAFAQQRIFSPLGMSHTHFHDDHQMIVPHRATGYAPRDAGGFAIDMSNFEELGDGSVMTTVRDLARWQRNFDAPVVGGKQAVALLQEPGIRSDGTRSPYAMGLILDEYRGFPRVQHTGEWVGYRSSVLRFPTERLDIIVLCNVVGDLDALALSERVADLYIGSPATEPTPAAAPVTAAELAADAGTYWDAETYAYLRFAVLSGSLALATGDGLQPLHSLGNGIFQADDSTTRYTFHGSASTMAVDAKDDDSDVVRLERVAADQLRESNMSDFTGTYYSEELGVSWTLDVRNGELNRSQWMFPREVLTPVFADVFTGALSEGRFALQFRRAAAGNVEGFSVGTSMVRPVPFRRCRPASPQDGGPLSLGCESHVPALEQSTRLSPDGAPIESDR